MAKLSDLHYILHKADMHHKHSFVRACSTTPYRMKPESLEHPIFIPYSIRKRLILKKNAARSRAAC